MSGNRFDEAAQTWDQEPRRRELAEALWTALRKAVPLERHWRVLDVGCGTGGLTLPLAGEVAEVEGVDASPGMLAVCGVKVEAARAAGRITAAVRLHGVDIQCPDARAALGHGYDLVVTALTMHHLADVPPVLDFFHESLSSGGRLCMMDLVEEPGTFHGAHGDVPHHGFGEARMRAWLDGAGFSACTWTTVHTITKTDASGCPVRYPVFLATATRSE